MSALTVSKTKMTARQFLALGEDPPGLRLELVEGEIAVTPSPAPDHSYTGNMLSHILLDHIERHDLGQLLGDVDTLLDDHNVRRPDLFFFRKDRLHLIGERIIEGPPDLCVEIVSPTSGKIDREDKFQQYAAFGVMHYWIVDPGQRTLEGHVLDAGRYACAGEASGEQTLALPPFADLPIPLARLWRPKR